MSELVAVRPAYIGIKADGSQFVIADDDGQPVAPSWNADRTALVDDIGAEHEIIRSPVKVLYCSHAPWALAQSGTVGSNGALTLGTVMLTVYSSGIWLYFPANAVYASSPAGWYWAVMSSTTAGTVYANYSADGAATLYPPTTPTPLVGTTGAAYTGFAHATDYVDVLPLSLGVTLAPGDTIDIELPLWVTNSANNKKCKVVNAAKDQHFIAPTVTTVGHWLKKVIQISGAGHTVRPEGWVSSDPNMNDMGSAIISLTDPVLVFQLNRAVATDACVFPLIRVTHYANTTP